MTYKIEGHGRKFYINANDSEEATALFYLITGWEGEVTEIGCYPPDTCSYQARYLNGCKCRLQSNQDVIGIEDYKGKERQPYIIVSDKYDILECIEGLCDRLTYSQVQDLISRLQNITEEEYEDDL